MVRTRGLINQITLYFILTIAIGGMLGVSLDLLSQGINIGIPLLAITMMSSICAFRVMTDTQCQTTKCSTIVLGVNALSVILLIIFAQYLSVCIEKVFIFGLGATISATIINEHVK